MSWSFGRPFRARPIGQDTSIIVGAKPPEQIGADRREGIARFGGEWREPNYAQAYFQAADLLVSRAVENVALDELGLPAFHLQRHATELILKELLTLAYETAGYLAELDVRRDDIFRDARKRLTKEHKLGALLNDLENVAKWLGLREPPASLRELVQLIETYEKTLTWARYAQGRPGNGTVVRHVEEEAAVPLVRLQQLLARASRDTAYPPDADGYGRQVYEEWVSAARRTGRLG